MAQSGVYMCGRGLRAQVFWGGRLMAADTCLALYTNVVLCWLLR